MTQRLKAVKTSRQSREAKQNRTERNRTIPVGFEGLVGNVGLDFELEGKGEPGYVVGASKTNGQKVVTTKHFPSCQKLFAS